MSAVLFPSDVALGEGSTRKDDPFLNPEKAREKEDDEDDRADAEGGGQAALPNVQKDDLARRRGQSGALPPRDPQQALVQTAMTQADLEKWQRLQMSTESRCLTSDLSVGLTCTGGFHV